MLILTRQPGEAVTVGDDIEFGVLEVKGRQVRIGIRGPDDVDIARAELLVTKNLPNECESD